MKSKFTLQFLSALLFFFTATPLLAQNAKRDRSLRQEATPHPQIVQKVASHDDLPSYELDYVWRNNAWDTIAQVTYTYSANGALVEQQIDFYDNGQFDPSSKRQYSYNLNGDLTEETVMVANGGIFENIRQTTHIYDALGDLIEVQSFTWASNAWDQIGGNQYAYTYNSSNQLLKKVNSVWDDGNSAYKLLTKQEIQWAQGEWSEYEYFKWDGNVWVPDTRTVDIVWYDFSKQLYSYVKHERYDSTAYVDTDRGTCTYAQHGDNTWVWEKYDNGSWNNLSRKVTEYDIHEHEILTENYSWVGSWALDEGFEYTYLYDAQGKTMEIVTQRRDQTLVLSNLSKKVFGSFFVGAVAPLTSNVDFTAFPNPVTDQLNFDLKLEKNGPVAIALFDIQGRKRLETVSNYNGNIISIPISSSLENGVYFYQLKMGDAFAKGKVVIQH